MEVEYTKYLLGRVNSQQYQTKYNNTPPTLEITKECCSHSDTVTSLMFYQNGNSFLSTSMDGYLMDWDTQIFDFRNDYHINNNGLLWGTTDDENFFASVNMDGSVSLIEKRSVCLISYLQYIYLIYINLLL